MMEFLLIFDDLQISKDDVVYYQEQNTVYRTIIQYFQLKKYAKNGNNIDINVLLELKQKKNEYVYNYIDKLKFLALDKNDKMYKCLRTLIYSLQEYVLFIESNENDSFTEFFLEFDIYTLIHLFRHIEINTFNHSKFINDLQQIYL